MSAQAATNSTHPSDYLQDPDEWRRAFERLVRNLEHCVAAASDSWTRLRDETSGEEFDRRRRLLAMVKVLAEHETRNNRQTRTYLHVWSTHAARLMETDEERYALRFAEVTAARARAAAASAARCAHSDVSQS